MYAIYSGGIPGEKWDYPKIIFGCLIHPIIDSKMRPLLSTLEQHFMDIKDTNS